jgi:hypothetical protein
MDGQGDGQGQEFGTAAQGPDHQIPVLNSFLAENADSDGCAEKCQETLEIQLNGYLGGLIFS